MVVQTAVTGLLWYSKKLKNVKILRQVLAYKSVFLSQILFYNGQVWCLVFDVMWFRELWHHDSSQAISELSFFNELFVDLWMLILDWQCNYIFACSHQLQQCNHWMITTSLCVLKVDKIRKILMMLFISHLWQNRLQNKKINDS